MRTKALLLGAAIGAVSLATSMAQVFSVNIVGYINLVVTPGFQMYANQLNNPAGNSIANLFPTPPGAITIYKFTGHGYYAIGYDPDMGWPAEAATTTLNPGEGCFIDNATGSTFTNTLVGDVQLNSSLTITPGFQVYSSVVPQEVPVESMDFPTAALGSCTFYFYNGHGYDAIGYDPDMGWPVAGGPSIAVGKSFFLDNSGGNTVPWARNFTVGP